MSQAVLGVLKIAGQSVFNAPLDLKSSMCETPPMPRKKSDALLGKKGNIEPNQSISLKELAKPVGLSTTPELIIRQSTAVASGTGTPAKNKTGQRRGGNRA